MKDLSVIKETMSSIEIAELTGKMHKACIGSNTGDGTILGESSRDEISARHI